ncbi:sigma-54 interaction domain-containing protein [Salinicoccus carnicancri]|uniref:sigma-54 interaction domain-containing protein n=1 Tax=Salinicoccus carnicancri TaxID=558170 RepID=UPI00031880B6|nr:sigma-54-dependent Fis family transcriptional regulator [Salinicoccus carnicancri]
MEEKLFTYEEFQSLIDSSYDGIHITDAQGVTLFYNKACEEIEGIEKADIIGRNVQEFVDSGVYPESITLEAIAQGERVNMFQNINDKLVMASATPFFSGDRMKGIIVNSRDITSLNALQTELEHAKHVNESYHLELEQLKYKEMDSDLVARDPAMEKIIKLVLRVAAVKSSVLIQGESGAGKGIIAHLIHKYGRESEQPFMKIDCGAITESLLETELFGYEKGAFMGAAEAGKRGLLELADGGTLFLDEIGEISFSMQSKLLSVINDREITRVGGTGKVPIDVRIIAATNKNLEKMVREKEFREDLYYRLNVVPIRVPPLRERKDDIYPLIMQNLENVNGKYGLDVGIDPKAVDILVDYHWPGNVRELENMVERLAVTATDDVIDFEHIPFEVKHARLESLAFLNTDNACSLNDIMAGFEKQVLLNALDEAGNVAAMAKALQIDPTTVRRKLHRYNIDFGR